jgi:hypothetical protein
LDCAIACGQDAEEIAEPTANLFGTQVNGTENAGQDSLGFRPLTRRQLFKDEFDEFAAIEPPGSDQFAGCGG